MKIFLTGGTGFIGSHFLDTALKKGYYIKALIRPKSKFKIFQKQNLKWLRKELYEINISDLKGYDAVVHLAAEGVSPKLSSWERCYSFNVTKSLGFIKKAIDININKIIITGSFAEYGKSALKYDFIPTNAPLEPIDIYSSSKAASSIAFQSLSYHENHPITYLRLFSVFGEGQFEKNFWPSLKIAALSGENFKMTNGEQIRDFIHIDNVIKQLMKHCNNETEHISFSIKNIGSGTPQSLKQFASYWWKRWDAKGELLIGAIPYRENEIMRYIPEL